MTVWIARSKLIKFYTRYPVEAVHLAPPIPGPPSRTPPQATLQRDLLRISNQKTPQRSWRSLLHAALRRIYSRLSAVTATSILETRWLCGGIRLVWKDSFTERKGPEASRKVVPVSAE